MQTSRLGRGMTQALLQGEFAKTAELYLYIEQRERSGRPCDKRPASNGRERFLIVEWKDYQQTGNYLFLYPGLAPPA